ncbi:hypothetical protein CAN34_10240 [Psychrobacter sp. DAB_AL32B]|nr:hypothetical protein CAN34_10240 [Psychrobacter sp. DAB_AL32B]
MQNTIKPQGILPNRPIKASCGLGIYSDSVVVVNLIVMKKTLILKDKLILKNKQSSDQAILIDSSAHYAPIILNIDA